MLDFSIDWLQFTVKSFDLDKIFNLYLNLDKYTFLEMEQGMLGYKKQLRNNNISILYDGMENMGTHVVISGQGCRFYENKQSLRDLINRLDDDCSITRIDFAFDDYSNEMIDLNSIIFDVRSGNVLSKWRKSIEITEREMDTGEVTGRTVNLGSRSSDVCMRIYDKKQEQKNSEIKHWNRLELEVKGKRAKVLQKKLIKEKREYQDLIIEIINNYIRFVKPNANDKNKSRWETREYWNNFVSTANKTSLSIKKEDKTIWEKKMWLNEQIAPSLASIVVAEEGDLSFVIDLINSGKLRLSESQKQMIQDHLTNK